MTDTTKLENRILTLLREYDFDVFGKRIYSRPIGFMPSRYFMPCRDIFDASERLIPIIRDNNYHRRLTQITS